MDLHRITPEYTVAPQVEPTDMAELARAGFTTVICNRPDAEVPPDLQVAAMRAAAEAAGLTFIDNPVVNGGLTQDMVETQSRAIADSTGPVFAYCRSGTRCTIVWALSQAGTMPTDTIIAKAAEAGYDVGALRSQIDALSR